MELLLSIKYLVCSSNSRAFLLLAVLLAGLPDHVVAANSVNVRAITSSFAPLQVLEDGVPGGYAVDVIGVIANKISTERGQNIVLNFEFLPWKRGFRAATSDQENILFFSLSRSPGRESLFHWIGEISPYDMHLFTLDPEIPGQFTTLEAIRESNKVIGVQGGSNVEELLRSHGFVEDMDFVTYSSYQKGINLLYRRRVDSAE